MDERKIPANRAYVVRLIAESFKSEDKFASDCLDTVLSAIEQALLQRDEVTLNGHFKVVLRNRANRSYRHPLTGESIPVGEGKKRVVFRPSARLTRLANQKPSNQELDTAQTNSPVVPV